MSRPAPLPLPVDAHLGSIAEAVRRHRAAVITAPPGAGKTTRIPPVLVEDGPLILLQPRRVAARALARRIAAERGWTVGGEVGWQVRFERKFGKDTRLLVATEGVLTARLLADPLLERFRTIVLDEFHERSLHADLALALSAQAVEARDDLRLVVMSATLAAEPIAEFLGGCPVIDVPGRAYPLAVEYAPDRPLVDAVCERLEAGGDAPRGHLLAFLPGAREIDRAVSDLRGRVPAGVRVLPLHGSLPPEAQDAAVAPSDARKVVLATNIAETSLTVAGVSDVVDGGTHKVLRLDAALGLDRLELERIPRDAADQRAGRAGRTGPGHVVRLWDERQQLEPQRQAEIRRVDLAGPFLDVLAWGEHPSSFRWFEAPDGERAARALELLERLGAVEQGSITPLGRALRRLPLHPRLGRVLLAEPDRRLAARACAVLSEGWFAGAGETRTVCDLLPLVDRIGQAPHRVREAAKQLEARAGEVDPEGLWRIDAEGPTLGAALLAGYPDRVARRREPGSPRLLLASGHGAELGRESGVHDGEFLVAVDLFAAPHPGQRGGGPRGGQSSRVRVAAQVLPEWVPVTRRETVHELDAESGRVRAAERQFHESLQLRQAPVRADAEHSAALRRDALLERGLGERAEALLRRLRFAGAEIDLPELLLHLCRGRDGWFEPDLEPALDWAARQALQSGAPATLDVPSGRSVRLHYRDEDTVVAAVKLQELFGLADTPRIGPRKVPVVFELLAPNGRPVQTTRDLRNFWNETYAEVRKELRGRYPKHPWPEDPWTAQPTHRTKRRPR
ncbi:hypothetical protein ABI59_10520 [Acidobacteria bacterium Mor1]|nr:hypothetical protein ABI59_10520 [Acidobacteria bacterium Mor1]